MLSTRISQQLRQQVRSFYQASAEQKQVDANWALAKIGLAPQAKVYRNLCAKNLAQYTGNDKQIFTATVSPAAKFVARDPTSVQKYKVVLKKVQEHLSARTLFVQDAAVGASGKNAVQARVIADSPFASQLARNLLFSVPLRPAAQFTPSINLLSAADLKLSAEEAKAINAESSAILLHPSQGSGIVVGAVGAAQVREALAQLTASSLASNSTSAHTLFPASSYSNDSILVVDPSASNYVLWSSSGFSSGFGGAVSADKPAAGDAVETSGSKTLVTRPSPVAANLFKHPTHIVLLSQAGEASSPITPEQAKSIVASSLSSLASAAEANTLAERFSKLATEHGVKLVSVNKSKVSDISSVIAKL